MSSRRNQVASALMVVALLPVFMAHASPPLEQSFMMREIQDGVESADLFEVWQVSFNPKGDLAVQVQVASFVELGDETRVYLWLHTSTRVVEVRPGIFKAECNGRLNPFAGLDLVFEVRDGRIVDLSGSTRAGTRGQAVVAYKIDRKTARERLELANPL